MEPKTLLTAILLEIGAYYFALDFTNSTEHLLLFFAFHAMASVVFSVAAHFMLPRRYRTPRLLALSLLFSFAFFIPLVGLFGILLAIFVTVIAPRISRHMPFTEIKRPEYVLSIREPEPKFRLTGMRQLLLDQDAPPEVRLKSLTALQNMPGRLVGPMLRRLLSDPADDIRLVAYGMLDVQEKRINASIQDELDRLQQTVKEDIRQNAWRHLAELYWELVYTGLVQGDVRKYALTEAMKYLELAHALQPEDPGLWYLKGRLLHAAGRLDEAGDALSLAVACGLQEARVLPYLAEIAFEQRDFPVMRQFLAPLADGQATPMMAPVIRFWLGKRAI